MPWLTPLLPLCQDMRHTHFWDHSKGTPPKLSSLLTPKRPSPGFRTVISGIESTQASHSNTHLYPSLVLCISLDQATGTHRIFYSSDPSITRNSRLPCRVASLSQFTQETLDSEETIQSNPKNRYGNWFSFSILWETQVKIGITYQYNYSQAASVAQIIKNLPRVRSLGQGWFPGEGNGYPLQYSCLENPYGQRSLTG